MKTLRYSFVAIGLALLAGCGEKVEQSASQAHAKVHLVNVLDKKMFDDAHIKGSVHVPLADIDAASAAWGKDDAIVIYCSNYMCTASGMAAQSLKKRGYTNVRVYEGGTAEWYQMSKQDASYELKGPQKEAYLSIVLEKPLKTSQEIEEISAAELKNLLKEANILS